MLLWRWSANTARALQVVRPDKNQRLDAHDLTVEDKAAGTLDPADWSELRVQGHRMLDD
ncbi:MAG: hypothetical protein JWM77_1098, partial [Rhodospirillales bacterium]|nr:hypothetical protein [Rhodospirillales bacterium]